MEGSGMNSLTTINALTVMNPDKARLMDMRSDPTRFPRLKSVSKEEAYYEMNRIVSQAFLYRGQEVETNRIQFISSALVDELLDDRQFGASNISFAEIQVVVKRAVLGGTEMFGVSVASLYKVIMDYIKGEGHDIELQLKEAKRRADEKSLKDSIIAPMLQSYSDKFTKEHKIK